MRSVWKVEPDFRKKSKGSEKTKVKSLPEYSEVLCVFCGCQARRYPPTRRSQRPVFDVERVNSLRRKETQTFDDTHEIFNDCSHENGSTSSQTSRESALLQVTTDTTGRDLQTRRKTRLTFRQFRTEIDRSGFVTYLNEPCFLSPVSTHWADERRW